MQVLSLMAERCVVTCQTRLALAPEQDRALVPAPSCMAGRSAVSMPSCPRSEISTSSGASFRRGSD